MNTPRINPYIVLFIGVLSVSTSAILVKLISAPSSVIAFYRLFFSVIIMLPLFLSKYIPELRRVTKRDWMFSLISGAFLAFHFILWFESLNYTSVASSTVLVTLQPLFVFIASYFVFKEKVSIKTIISSMIAITGSVLISWGDFYISGKALYGDILALLACALITFYLMFGQSVRKRLSLITYTFLVYMMSAVILFFYVLVTGDSFYPYETNEWFYFILLAVFPNLLGHTLFNWSLKWVTASTISIAILFEPVGASIMAYFLLNETLVWTQIIGGLIVIGGIVLFISDVKLFKSRKNSKYNRIKQKAK